MKRSLAGHPKLPSKQESHQSLLWPLRPLRTGTKELASVKGNFWFLSHRCSWTRQKDGQKYQICLCFPLYPFFPCLLAMRLNGGHVVVAVYGGAGGYVYWAERKSLLLASA